MMLLSLFVPGIAFYFFYKSIIANRNRKLLRAKKLEQAKLNYDNAFGVETEDKLTEFENY